MNRSDTTPRMEYRETTTFREIAQQPEMWRRTASEVRRRRDDLDAFLRPILSIAGLRVVLTGAGTSAFVGEIAASALAERWGIRVEALATTEIVSSPRTAFAEDVPTLLVSFARSGNSPESVAVTTLADQLLSEVFHLVITCDAHGRLARAHVGRSSRVLVMPPETNDRGFAMTSSFTSMLLASLLVFLGEQDDVTDALSMTARQIIDACDEIGELIDAKITRVVYLGGGALRGLARESALKMLELTAGRIVAFDESPLGFRHGPKALMDDETLAVIFESADEYTAQYDDDMVAELRADRTGHVVRVGGKDADARPHLALPLISGAQDAYRAMAAVVFAQFLALHASVRLGCSPDDPFPSGAVNRVVQGVTIHPLNTRKAEE